jgi:cytochrome P450
VTHRHPAFWDNPEGFDRSGSPRADRPAAPHGLLPVLRRSGRCIGEDFAPLQLPLVVAMVSQRYRLSLLPSRPAEVGVAVTLRPRAPLLVRVERVG